jgi:ubiquinol-cytochrome c reductase cytochrome b subunit
MIIKQSNTIINSVSLVSSLGNHLKYYPTPASFFYIFGVGSLLGVFLIVQIITGILLAMHYVPHIEEAFGSVERIMREIPSGWILRYMHANGSSFIFILLYVHIARGLYFQSYRTPKQWVWISGSILFILMAGISFSGYTLPWGQMSFWGSTVITNLLTAIPVIGSKLVIWIWGGFAITQSTLNRFFSLHYILSIGALALSGLHLILLHFVGSTSPVVNDSEPEANVKFFPFFVVKDIFTFLVVVIGFILIIVYKPNVFGHPDNYLRADALVTPAHIVPEWYFLPFYAMLKAFPSKSAGAVAMLGSMLILLILPFLDTFTSGLNIFSYDPRYKVGFEIFLILLVINIILLGWLGSLAVTDTNQTWMQVGTAAYFSYFTYVIAVFSVIEAYFFKFISELSEE